MMLIYMDYGIQPTYCAHSGGGHPQCAGRQNMEENINLKMHTCARCMDPNRRKCTCVHSGTRAGTEECHRSISRVITVLEDEE